MNLPVNLNGLTLSHNFLVVDHLISDILIGLDFLSFANAVLDFANHNGSFYDKLVTLPLLSTGDQMHPRVLSLPAISPS